MSTEEALEISDETNHITDVSERGGALHQLAAEVRRLKADHAAMTKSRDAWKGYFAAVRKIKRKSK